MVRVAGVLQLVGSTDTDLCTKHGHMMEFDWICFTELLLNYEAEGAALPKH